MKRLTYLILSALFISQTAFAQQRFSDGEVTYSVKVDLRAGASPRLAKAFENSRLVYSFKNYFFRSDMNVGETTYTSIRNSRDHSAVTLIDSGPSKYLIRMNAADLAKESAPYAGVSFSEVAGSRKIAGYDCKKAVGKLSDGSTFTVYYTPQLVPEDVGYSARFKGLKGLPLEFEMNTPNHLKMTMTATSVRIAPQPSAKFNTPVSGYREITYTELENLRKK